MHLAIQHQMDRVQKKMERWESMALNIKDRRASDSVEREEWEKLQQTKEAKATGNRKTFYSTIAKDLNEKTKTWVKQRESLFQNRRREEYDRLAKQK